MNYNRTWKWLTNLVSVRKPTTFSTVTAACNKKETIISKLQNIPAPFNE